MKKTLKALIGDMIDRYGMEADLLSGGEITHTRAFLHPITSRSWQNMERMVPSGGELPRGQYLFIGTPELSVRPADVLQAGGRSYIFRRVDSICFRNTVVYHWGLCVEGGGEDPWTPS